MRLTTHADYSLQVTRFASPYDLDSHDPIVIRSLPHVRAPALIQRVAVTVVVNRNLQRLWKKSITAARLVQRSDTSHSGP